MEIVLYIIWGALPGFFFLMALWAKLEGVSNKGKKENPGDFFHQGLFVLACVLIALAIDTYLLGDFVTNFSPEYLSLNFYRIILLPLILLIGAQIIGPSKEISISKAPRPTDRNRKR